jgi:L-aminopeptidase/D-esterase-like protein
MKGGLGTASLRLPNGVVIGALVVVNCVGNVIDPGTGKILAGSRRPNGTGFVDTLEWYHASIPAESSHTTIGVIATNVAFNKAQLKKIAQMGHDGMARTINPVHTPWDGDTLFALSTGAAKTVVDVGRLGALAAEVVSEAIRRAVLRAKAIPGYPEFPAFADLP